MASIYNTLLRTSVVYTLSGVLTSGLSLLLLPLYTRYLSQGDYGSLDLMIVFANLANLVVSLEIYQGLGRLYSQEKSPCRKRVYAGSAVCFTAICHAIFLLLMLVFASSLAPLVMGRDGLQPEFRIGALYIGLNALYLVVQSVLRWQFSSGRYAMVSLTYAVVTVLASVVLVIACGLGLAGFLWGMIAGAAAALALAMWLLRADIAYRLDVPSLREMLHFSILLVPSSLAVFFGAYIDRLMINYFLGTEQVGLFAVGYRVASLLMFAVIGIRGSLTPLVYAHSDEAETPARLATIFRVFVAASIILYSALGLFAVDIVGILATQEYLGAARVVVLLAPALLLSQMYIFAPGMGISKKTGVIASLNILGMLLNAGLNYLLIPQFGVAGAAAATLLGYALTFTIFMSCSQRLYPVPHQWMPVVSVALLAMAVVIFSSGLHMHLWLRLPLNVLLLAALCLACVKARLVNPAELGFVLGKVKPESRKSA